MRRGEVMSDRCLVISRSGLICLIMCFCVACGNKEPDDTTPKGASEITQNDVAKLTARVDRKGMSIADTLKLTLELDLPEDFRPEFPRGEKIGDFEVAGSDSTDPVLIEGGKLRFVHNYELEPFLAGEYRIPKLDIHYRKKGRKAEDTVPSIQSKPFSITVTSVIGDKADVLKDISGPVDPPEAEHGWVYYVVLGILGFILAWLIGAFVVIRILRMMGKRPPAAPRQVPVIKRDPAVVALEEMDDLVKQDLPGQGHIKPFYLKLSGILRHYIEGRFDIQAPEQTTEEFLVSLRNSKEFAEDQKTQLRNFLNHCDLVKFAEHQPDATDIEGSLGCCRTFVEQTREGRDAI